MSSQMYDIYEPEDGHIERFQSKLNPKNTKYFISKYIKYSMVASVALILGISLSLFLKSEVDLASVSPELKQTQNYFEGSIYEEIAVIKKMETLENKSIIDDGLSEISEIENDYEKLKEELNRNGYNKSIIHAMIMNYQQRMEVLQGIIENIEINNNLKHHKNETNSI
jgi:hypothetical protein